MNLATIERILEVKPHPNADRLDLVKVLGYQCVTQKGLYQVGDQIVYIKTDTVLPLEPWTETYRKYSPKRVKAVRLRDEFSEGIILPIEELNKVYSSKVMNGVHVLKWDEGTDVSEILNVTKYEPPIPQDLNAKSSVLPFSLPRTDEDRWENIVSKLPFNERVDVSLKIDGSSVTYGYKLDEDKFFVTSRGMELHPEFTNNYTYPLSLYPIENKLKEYCKKHNISLALRGEVYGQGIQDMNKNPHSKMSKNVAFFSVYLIDEHRYARINDQHYFVNVCKELNLPTVPILESNVLLTQDLIDHYSSGIKTITNGDYFEGVVVQHNKGSFKIINKFYDANK